MITEAGLYEGVDEAKYHSGEATSFESLSQSSIKLLLPPSCPARFRWATDNPEPFKREFDVGSAAHQLVLGAGPDLVCVPGAWRTAKVKAEVEEIRARGDIPLHEADWHTVHDMADALRNHPVAGPLLTEGQPEVSAYWQDPSGVWIRGRFDWLPATSRPIITDYKTDRDADPESWTRKSVIDHSYFLQEYVYRLLYARLAGIDLSDVSFVFVVQEKTPPYLVSVVELPAEASAIGRIYYEAAIELFRTCQASDRWPGYGDDRLTHPDLPQWFVSRYLG